MQTLFSGDLDWEPVFFAYAVMHEGIFNLFCSIADARAELEALPFEMSSHSGQREVCFQRRRLLLHVAYWEESIRMAREAFGENH